MWKRYANLSSFSAKFIYYVFYIFSDKSQGGGGGEREHANALYLACRHLPTPLLSTPGERAGMLAEAAKTLEKIGDKKKLLECYQLMKSIGGSSNSN
jgi:sterol regulatory element-binding transcription factor 1